MQWQDDGILLTLVSYGERAGIAKIFTQHHGLCSGFLPHRPSSKKSAGLSAGAQVHANWWARSENSLGKFAVETFHPLPLQFIQQRCRSLALAALLHFLASNLEEHEEAPIAYAQLCRLLNPEESLSETTFLAYYFLLQVQLLAELGFGLSLDRCVLSGSTTDLTYLSPKTGKAVCTTSAEPYKHKLLHLPAFILPHSQPLDPPPTPQDLQAAATIIRHFWQRSFGFVDPTFNVLCDILRKKCQSPTEGL